MVADVLLQDPAQKVFLVLILATALGTLAGAWFSARAQTGMVWLAFVLSLACGISAVVALALLPMVLGMPSVLWIDAALALVTASGAGKTWSGTLHQAGLLS